MEQLNNEVQKSSNTPILQYSGTPVLQYSNSPLLQDSVAPLFYLTPQIDDFHAMVRFRVPGGRSFGQNGELSRDAELADPPPHVRLPLFRVLRLMYRVYARGELELLTGRHL